jgi:hypothetical protein
MTGGDLFPTNRGACDSASRRIMSIGQALAIGEAQSRW